MSLRGTAFLAIWNDIDDTLDPVEYDAWLTHEHMIERLEVPGFLRGRRYVASGVPPQQPHHRYLNFYETRDADVLTSPAYLARLNQPTPLTQRVMPHLTHFLRMGCRTVGTAGRHVGGALATLRFQAPAARQAQAWPAAAQALCDALVRETPVVMGCHLGSPQAAVAAVSTRERELRPAGDGQEGSDDHVLLVESANEQALRACLPRIESALRERVAGVSEVRLGVYGLSCLVEA